jgi:hypothetical protein
MKALCFHHQTKSIFAGVYARNKIPKVPKQKRIAYIVNTDPANKPGKHWVAFFLTRKTIYYFDPYGIPPHGFHRILRSRKNVCYFGQRLQGMGRMCGHYCLYFILAMQTNLSLEIFGSDLSANDRIVKRLAEKHFPYINTH